MRASFRCGRILSTTSFAISRRLRMRSAAGARAGSGIDHARAPCRHRRDGRIPSPAKARLCRMDRTADVGRPLDAGTRRIAGGIQSLRRKRGELALITWEDMRRPTPTFCSLRRADTKSRHRCRNSSRCVPIPCSRACARFREGAGVRRGRQCLFQPTRPRLVETAENPREDLASRCSHLWAPRRGRTSFADVTFASDRLQENAMTGGPFSSPVARRASGSPRRGP